MGENVVLKVSTGEPIWQGNVYVSSGLCDLCGCGLGYRIARYYKSTMLAWMFFVDK